MIAESSQRGASKDAIQVVPPTIKREIDLPPMVRNVLLEGMSRVVKRTHQTGIWALTALYKDFPGAISDFIEMEGENGRKIKH